LAGGGNCCCFGGAGGAENTYVYGSVQGLQSSGTYYLSPSSQAVSVLQPYVTVYKLLKVKKAA
jgi:hypothetical protein